ncbi:MAG: winged helix-turn-helix domain-containing protein [Planctomycetes bacterium]|nr:winged helix-turn-helix domain-containing protein [Planctomycetota bacterium]
MSHHNRGYTAKRPRRRARKQDLDEIRRWLEETYPAIERRAEAEGAEIHRCDETGVRAAETPHVATLPRVNRSRWRCPIPTSG